MICLVPFSITIQKEQIIIHFYLILQEKGEMKKNIDVLLEMFPCCSVRQAEKILSMAKGNLEDAVQIIVDSEEQFDNASDSQVSSTNSEHMIVKLLWLLWICSKDIIVFFISVLTISYRKFILYRSDVVGSYRATAGKMFYSVHVF